MPRRKLRAQSAPDALHPNPSPDPGVHHPYDKAARYAINIDPQGFLDWFCPNLAAVGRFSQWALVQGPVDPDALQRVGDTIADLIDLEDSSAPLAVPIEIQTVPEPGFLTRALGYTHMFRRVLKRPGSVKPYDIFPGVIYLTGSGDGETIVMAREKLGAKGLRFEIISKVMAEVDAVSLLDQIDKGEVKPCMLYWISLMRNAEMPDTIKRWRALVQRFIHWEERRNLAVVMWTFSELPRTAKVWSEHLKEWPVIESQLYKEWTLEAEKRGRAEGKAEGKVEGKAEGKVEGKAEGKAEGKVEGKAEGQASALTVVLGHQFGSSIPKDIAERIAEQHDAEALTRWLKAVLNAQSLDQVREMMGIANAPSPKKRVRKASKNGHA